MGVAELARSREFYAQLGWQGQQVEETVLFQAGGLVVVLWARQNLASDAGVADTDPTAFSGIALAHNVRSPELADEIIETAGNAGATVTKAPAPTFYGGYPGYFADPEGHLWEIAYNPGFPLDEDGNVVLPDMLG